MHSLHPLPDNAGLDIVFSNSGPILDDVSIGDSICVNGTCLTVTEFEKEGGNGGAGGAGGAGGTFKVGLANETLNRTNLGEMEMILWLGTRQRVIRKGEGTHTQRDRMREESLTDPPSQVN